MKLLAKSERGDHAIVWESVETGPFVILGGLVVDRTLRRKGIGRTLVIKAEGFIPRLDR